MSKSNAIPEGASPLSDASWKSWDAPAKSASIHGARAVKVGSDGTVWILERNGNTLRAVDPGMGVIRHADAGYEIAVEFASQHGIDRAT